MKTCNKCKIEYPETSEYFYKDKSIKSGFRGNCKSCNKQYLKDNADKGRQYRKDNKEKIKIRTKQWRKNNAEEIKERKKQYYIDNADKIKKYCKDNREKIKIRMKKYRKDNAEIIKKRTRQYNIDNADRLKELRRQYYNKYKDYFKIKRRQWYKNNLEISKLYGKKYRSIKKQLPYTLTTFQWNAIKKHFNNSCAYCGNKTTLTQDHFIPLSKGGGYTKCNIIPACRSCNSSKKNKYFYQWYPKFCYYTKDKEQKIYDYIEKTKGTKQLSLI